MNAKEKGIKENDRKEQKVINDDDQPAQFPTQEKEQPETVETNGQNEMITISMKEKEAFEKKIAEFDAVSDRYIRLCAEFENARKRWDREKVETIKFGNYALLRELITIVDELEHALKAVKENANAQEIGKGINLTYNNLCQLLKRQGVTAIASVGTKFDPHRHEIVLQREDDTVDEHTIIEEIQKGYLLEDRVLRTAKVIISIKPKNSSVQKSNEESETELQDSNKGENETE